MTHTAKGTFDVKIEPDGTPDEGEGSTLGTFLLTKRYHGPLNAESHGHMISAASTAEKHSAAYAAVERLTGSLDGRSGSFALVHRGIMSPGGRELRIAIVPDSGTGELKGISGTLDIDITPDRTHHYVLEYTLPGGDVH
ncbi:DUF3224 domain-containing protein [Luteibacter aegosomatis]|uniref:DUF3224 domain-containing protein n=1 Tax=Luteibacter aegosomatis TaxID=2911537 RepID=UPI001FF8DFCE|nr:DUF3224 domain-containing protein [Luteibacter aegosomatis]UPG87289.1 DUF3224 domain-containing protein [Luteibacter aegosomatis]